MGEYDRRKDIEAEGQRATMTPNKPDLSRAGKGTAYKIGFREGMNAAAARITELENALRNIRDWRKSCREYDKDTGHDPRDFGEEDIRILEFAARAALKEQT